MVSFRIVNKDVLVYEVKKLQMEETLAFFIFYMIFYIIKSGYVATRRKLEVWRASRALGYSRSVVLFPRQSEFAAPKCFLFIFCCDF